MPRSKLTAATIFSKPLVCKDKIMYFLQRQKAGTTAKLVDLLKFKTLCRLLEKLFNFTFQTER